MSLNNNKLKKDKRWNRREHGATIQKGTQHSRPPEQANEWHHPSVKRPTSQFCGVARQPNWDSKPRETRERKPQEKRNSGGTCMWRRGSLTNQASVRSSGSACAGPGALRWPCPPRACCDRVEAGGGLRSGSCHRGPWTCSEWAARHTPHLPLDKFSHTYW